MSVDGGGESNRPRLKERDDGRVKERSESRRERKRKLSNVSLDPNLFRKLTNTKHTRQNTKVDGPNNMTREEFAAYESLRQQQQRGTLPQPYGNYGASNTGGNAAAASGSNNENNQPSSSGNMIDIRDIEPYVTQLLEQKQLLSEELKENQENCEELKRRNTELDSLINDYQKQLEKLQAEKEQYLHDLQTYKEQAEQGEEIRRALAEEHEERVKLMEMEKDKQVERLDTDQDRIQLELDKVIHENTELRKLLDEREVTIYKLQQQVNNHTLLKQEKKVLEVKHLKLQKEHEMLHEEVNKLHGLLQNYATDIQQLNEAKGQLEEMQQQSTVPASDFAKTPRVEAHRAQPTIMGTSSGVPSLEEQMGGSEIHARKSLEGDEFEQKHRETPPGSPSASPEKGQSAGARDNVERPSVGVEEEENDVPAGFPQTWEEILKSLNKKNRNDPSTQRSDKALSVQSNYSEEQVGDRLEEIEEELRGIKEMLKQLANSSDPVHVIQEIRPLERLIRQLHIKLDGRAGGHEPANRSQHAQAQSAYGIVPSPIHISASQSSRAQGGTNDPLPEELSNADTMSSRHRDSTQPPRERENYWYDTLLNDLGFDSKARVSAAEWATSFGLSALLLGLLYMLRQYGQSLKLRNPRVLQNKP